MTFDNYIHGTSSSEQERLILLNNLTNQHFIEFLELEENSSILEVGCGLGILTVEVAKLVSHGEVIGLDNSTKQLERAREELPNLRFIQGDAHELPFRNERFDIVYCRYLLEHVADPTLVVREIYRVLKRKGKVFVQENNILVNNFDPDCYHFETVCRQMAVLQQKLGGDALIGKRLFPLLKQAGFCKIELSIQPEVHYYDKKTFRPWIQNLIGCIQSASDKLVCYNLVNQEEINHAIEELTLFMNRDDATVFFYWNRALGVK
jgi:ubiquinone/menaquinone biosynthesis C-methylase UbiE